MNYPLQYFAERIGGEYVKVFFPAPADTDPANWSPDPEIVADYQQADLILLNGAGYARWVARASLPERAKVDTSAAFADQLIPLEGAGTHTHGPEGDHEHVGTAFTTWLDLTLAVEQARAIAQAFEEARPEQANAFRRSLEELVADLAELDDRLEALATKVGAEPLLFSHPVYQYLIRRYRLNGRSLHWEPDEPPDLEELARFREDHPARWMIWEADPLPETVAALEGVGVSSVVFAPCGYAPKQGDLIAEMKRNVARLERGPGSTSP
jgi:zinc transport system substrate-binding protein